jgi:hypothetical protein
LPPPAVAVLAAIGLVAGVLQAVGLLGPWWALAWLPAVGYLIGVSAVGLTRLGGDGLTARLLNAVVLATMHLSWGLGFLRGWLLGAESTVDRSRVK